MQNDYHMEGALYFLKKDIWQRSFTFGLRVIQMTKKFDNISLSWILTKQVVRSATSIAANITEGSGASSKKEFIRYMDIARKSGLETYNWLLFIEESFQFHGRMKKIKEENTEIVKILSTIVLNAKKNS